MRDKAKEYYNFGLATLPVKLDKSPAVKSWKDGVKDLSLFEGSEGIGIICGEKSGNLEVLDFDNHFGDAKKNLSEFINVDEIKEIYDRTKLVIESTQSGGYHLLYRCNKIEGNKKLASKPKWDEKRNRFIPDAIIETRGEGGYIVAAPTKGYKVVKNDILNVPTITENEREILINTAKTFNTWVEFKHTEQEESDKPGNIYNNKTEAIDEMKGALLRAGWKNLGKNIWQRPGKSKGISATVGKVAPNVFYCFTANGFPFEPNSGYKPFQVVGLLDYNSDFKKFAKDLSERYDLGTKPEYNQKIEPKKEEKKEVDYENILSKTFIDLTIKPEKPPLIMEISNNVNGTNVWQRLLTLGNFSAIHGKAKSKKTFATTLPMAALIGNSNLKNKFRSKLPDSKRMVFRFDTEQGEYDSYMASKRIEKMVGYHAEHFGTFGLRELEPSERLDVIDYALNKFKDNVGFVLIDGVADLIKSINDEEEAVKVVTKLMQWTKKYNCHICTIIHQNKGDNYATGHLGSYILKKAECVISVEKDQLDSNKSIIKCDMIRGVSDFEPFSFHINDFGLPEIDGYIDNVQESKMPWD